MGPGGCTDHDTEKLAKSTINMANFIYEVITVIFVDFFSLHSQCIKNTSGKGGICRRWRHDHRSGCRKKREGSIGRLLTPQKKPRLLAPSPNKRFTRWCMAKPSKSLLKRATSMGAFWAKCCWMGKTSATNKSKRVWPGITKNTRTSSRSLIVMPIAPVKLQRRTKNWVCGQTLDQLRLGTLEKGRRHGA